MKISKMIKVMQHYKNGGTVECAVAGFDDWSIANRPCWNWDAYTYRIKESKQKVTIEKWLCRDNQGVYEIIESSNVNKYKLYEKIKLIESYEVEL